jgi:hypothetical protein
METSQPFDTVVVVLVLSSVSALLCNLMAKCGVNNSFFPARLLSYLLLPYILPASIFLHVNYR